MRDHTNEEQDMQDLIKPEGDHLTYKTSHPDHYDGVNEQTRSTAPRGKGRGKSAGGSPSASSAYGSEEESTTAGVTGATDSIHEEQQSSDSGGSVTEYVEPEEELDSEEQARAEEYAKAEAEYGLEVFEKAADLGGHKEDGHSRDDDAHDDIEAGQPDRSEGDDYDQEEDNHEEARLQRIEEAKLAALAEDDDYEMLLPPKPASPTRVKLGSPLRSPDKLRSPVQLSPFRSPNKLVSPTQYASPLRSPISPVKATSLRSLTASPTSPRGVAVSPTRLATSPTKLSPLKSPIAAQGAMKAARRPVVDAWQREDGEEEDDLYDSELARDFDDLDEADEALIKTLNDEDSPR
jgi:hypothetical protein